MYDYLRTTIGIHRTNGKWFTKQTSFSTQWTTEYLCLRKWFDRRPRCTRHYMSSTSGALFVSLRNGNSQVTVEKGTRTIDTKVHVSRTRSDASVAAKITSSNKNLHYTAICILSGRSKHPCSIDYVSSFISFSTQMYIKSAIESCSEIAFVIQTQKPLCPRR